MFKNILILLAGLCAMSSCKGQNYRDRSEDTCYYYYDTLVGYNVYTKMDKVPQFPGGEIELYKFIKKNLILSSEELEICIDGLVIEFIVSKEGRAIHTKKNAMVDQKISTLISKMPDWIPGRCGNKAIGGVVKIPVKF